MSHSSVAKARSGLYTLAKILGDVQAVQRGARQHSIAPVAKRMERRVVGRAVGKGLGRLGL